MKKLTRTTALTIDLFHRIVKNQADKYWRYYMMWYDHGNLADNDPKEFIKRESNSGSAMWDDPPEDWSERDLYIWSKGYVSGREVETGNITGELKYLESLSSQLLNNDYGFKKGIPSLEQIEIHANRNFMGFWIVLIDNEKNNDFIHKFPVMNILQVAKNKIQIWEEDKGKWVNLTKKDQKRMLEFMPVDMTGIPSSWNNLKSRKKKNDNNDNDN